MLSKTIKQFNAKGEVYLRVKIHPGAAKNEIKGMLDDGTIKISIAAPPEKNKANIALLKLLAKVFTTDKNNVKIISGFTERVKLIKITDI